MYVCTNCVRPVLLRYDVYLLHAECLSARERVCVGGTAGGQCRTLRTAQSSPLSVEGSNMCPPLASALMVTAAGHEPL